MTEQHFDTITEAAEAAGDHGVVEFMPAHTNFGGSRTYPAKWRVTTLDDPRPSRHPGYTDVPMWARDVEVGFFVSERSSTVVTARREYTDDYGTARVVLTTDAGEYDFPKATGILTATVATGPVADDAPVLTARCRDMGEHDHDATCFEPRTITVGDMTVVLPD